MVNIAGQQLHQRLVNSMAVEIMKIPLWLRLNYKVLILQGTISIGILLVDKDSIWDEHILWCKKPQNITFNWIEKENIRVLVLLDEKSPETFFFPLVAWLLHLCSSTCQQNYLLDIQQHGHRVWYNSCNLVCVHTLVQTIVESHCWTV